MRIPTNWYKSSAEVPIVWSNTLPKSPSVWSVATKAASQWSGINKNSTVWVPMQSLLVAWHYDDATQKYDDTPIRGYDYFDPVTNSINDKKPTAWAAL